jgi:hypothetical protein
MTMVWKVAANDVAGARFARIGRARLHCPGRGVLAIALNRGLRLSSP